MRLNSRKRKVEKKYIILIIALGVCIMIGLLSLIVNDNRPLTFIEKGAKDVGLTIENILYSPVRFIESKVDKYNDMKRIYNKYKKIDDLESKTLLLDNENKELKKNINDLKATLNLNSILTDYTPINATVINRNVGDWYNTLTIDKGEKQGVKINMVVITNEGLIGKVIKTTFYTSDVKLITTPDLNSKISVGINSSTTTYGLLSGYDSNNKQLIITDIIDGTTIKVGDKVTTSGLSELFPSGIIVGTVAKIENDDFGISKVIKVSPSADFNNLRYITVLKRNEQ